MTYMKSSTKKGVTSEYIKRRMKAKEIKERHKYRNNYLDSEYSYDLQGFQDEYNALISSPNR